MSGRLFVKRSCPAVRSSAALASFVAVVLMASVPAHGQVYWSNTASGDWFAASNWGGTLPDSGGGGVISNGGTATIASSNAYATVLTLGGTGGGTLQMTAGALSTTGSLNVGFGGNGAIVQSGGGISVGTETQQPFYLGFDAGSSGIYALSGNGGIFAQTEYVGYSGRGSVVQTGGNNGAAAMYLAYNAGSSATYSLSGTGVCSATNEYLAESGTASYTQCGGTNTINSNFMMTGGATSCGSYALSGSGLLVAGEEGFYGNGTITFTQTGGTNSVSVFLLGGAKRQLCARRFGSGNVQGKRLDRRVWHRDFHTNGRHVPRSNKHPIRQFRKPLRRR